MSGLVVAVLPALLATPLVLALVIVATRGFDRRGFSRRRCDRRGFDRDSGWVARNSEAISCNEAKEQTTNDCREQAGHVADQGVPHEEAQEQEELEEQKSAHKDCQNRGRCNGDHFEDVHSPDSCRMNLLFDLLKDSMERTSSQQCLCGRIVEFRLRSIRNADSKELTQRSPGNGVVYLQQVLLSDVLADELLAVLANFTVGFGEEGQELVDVTEVRRVKLAPEGREDLLKELVDDLHVGVTGHKYDLDVVIQADKVLIEEASRGSDYGVVVTNDFVEVGLVVGSAFLAEARSFEPQREVALVAVAGCLQIVDLEVELLESIADA